MDEIRINLFADVVDFGGAELRRCRIPGVVRAFAWVWGEGETEKALPEAFTPGSTVFTIDGRFWIPRSAGNEEIWQYEEAQGNDGNYWKIVPRYTLHAGARCCVWFVPLVL